jgi:transposase
MYVRCGRQFAAWLGITPPQYSTDGKARLGRVTRLGDTYLRALLMQGACSVAGRIAGRPEASNPTRRLDRHPLRAHRLSQDLGGN